MEETAQKKCGGGKSKVRIEVSFDESASSTQDSGESYTERGKARPPPPLHMAFMHEIMGCTLGLLAGKSYYHNCD